MTVGSAGSGVHSVILVARVLEPLGLASRPGRGFESGGPYRLASGGGHTPCRQTATLLSGPRVFDNVTAVRAAPPFGSASTYSLSRIVACGSTTSAVLPFRSRRRAVTSRDVDRAEASRPFPDKCEGMRAFCSAGTPLIDSVIGRCAR